MDTVKIAFASILTVLLYALVKQLKAELAPLVILGGVAVIFLELIETFASVTGTVSDMIRLAGMKKENVGILIKSLGIALVTQTAADICRDNSCSSVASAVELAGRVGAITLAMPMLQSVASLALGLIT